MAKGKATEEKEKKSMALKKSDKTVSLSMIGF